MNHAAANPAHYPGRVLVVDDDAPTLRLIEFILQSEGYEVFGAPNGMAARSLFLDERPDILLLNVQMPDSNGFEVYDNLRDLGYSGPVVFVTARPDIAEVLAERRIKAAGYLVKPLHPEEVVGIVRQVLRSQPKAAVHASPARLTPSGNSPCS